METFTLIVIVGLGVVVLVLLAIGRWHPRSAGEITDKDRQMRWATQAEIEEREIPEMIEGQNVYRRARGEEDVTEADARRQGAARQQDSLERARRAEEHRDS